MFTKCPRLLRVALAAGVRNQKEAVPSCTVALDIFLVEGITPESLLPVNFFFHRTHFCALFLTILNWISWRLCGGEIAENQRF